MADYVVKFTGQDNLSGTINKVNKRCDIDLNNDGTIDFKEFSIMMKKILV